MLGLYLSTMMVVVMSVDRYQAIIHPLKRSQAGKRRFNLYILTAWGLSVVISIPQVRLV